MGSWNQFFVSRYQHDFNMTSMQLFVLAMFMIVAVAADGFAPSSYKAPEGKSDYHHDSYSKGRVKIQVYRGPDSHKGYEHGGHDDHGYGHDDGYFAPSGYYVYQPEDDKAYGYH